MKNEKTENRLSELFQAAKLHKIVCQDFLKRENFYGAYSESG